MMSSELRQAIEHSYVINETASTLTKLAGVDKTFMSTLSINVVST
jgi:hypothetical protein